MGIVYRKRPKGGKTYTEYQYWENGKVKTIYCGIKGKPETEKKVRRPGRSTGTPFWNAWNRATGVHDLCCLLTASGFVFDG